MKKIIIEAEEMVFGDSYEVRCYERGLWQHDCYVNDIEEAIEKMNVLIQKYDYKDDEVEVIKITYFKNITEEIPF